MNGDDVEEGRKVEADPWTGIVLVRNGIDAKLANKASNFFLSPGVLDLVECFGQDIGSTPSKNPERLLGSISGVDQGGGSIARCRSVKSSKTIDRLSNDNVRVEVVGRRVGASFWNVRVEVVNDLSVAINHAKDGRGIDGVVLPRRGHSSDVNNVQFVGMGHEPDETHLIVRLVGNVGHDEDSAFVLIASSLAHAVVCAHQ